MTITYTFNDPRTFPQVLLHFVVLRIGAIIALLYFTLLQRAPRQKRGQSLLLFIFLPTFPLASIICRLFYCIRLASTKPWPSDRSGYLVYLFSAVLGLHTWTEFPSPKQPLKNGATEIKPKFSDNDESSFLLSGEFSDFQRLKCSCTALLCSRFKTRSFLGTVTLLSVILFHCTITFLLYIRRCSHTYLYMAKYLLQGTPPGSVEADIYANALETISGFDQLNAIWALGGMAVATSALMLRIAGWEWKGRELGNGSDQKSSEALKLSYAELPVTLILYVFLTRQSWARFLPTWDSTHPMQSLVGTVVMLGGGIYASYVTYCWARGKVFWKKEPTGALVSSVWIIFVTQWPVIYTVRDAWELVSCVSGGECPYPLFLWKDTWSDFWWVY